MSTVNLIEKERVKYLISLIELRKTNACRKDEKLDKLAKKQYLDPIKIKEIYDLDGIKSTDEILVIDQLEVLCQLYLKGIQNVTYIQYSNGISDEKIPTTNMLGYEYINVTSTKELSELKLNKKFDIILANPPYKSLSLLHQRFFNKSFELLKDGGVMTIVQPSSPYITAFDDSTKKRPQDAMLRDSVLNNKCSVKLLPPTIIKNDRMYYPLAITTIVKNKPGFKGVDKFTDLSGVVYNNVNINDINITETNPKMHRIMVDKIKEYVELKGDLNESIFCKNTNLGVVGEDQHVVKLSQMRGSSGTDTDNGYKRASNFYTWFPKDNDEGLPNFRTKTPGDDIRYGVIVDKNVDPKTVYKFFKTYFARYCMAVGKFNQDVGAGAITTPNMDFSQEWTDKQLFNEVGFTDEEIAEVYRIIPKFH